MADIKDFSEILGQRESSGNYKAIGTEGGYIGKYQFGWAALHDLGYIKNKKPKGMTQSEFLSNPANWSGKSNIKSQNDFLSNNNVQEEAFTQWDGLLTQRTAPLLEQYGGQQIDGMTITPERLKAASHLLGTGEMKKMLERGTFQGGKVDALGTSAKEYFELFPDGQDVKTAPRDVPFSAADDNFQNLFDTKDTHHNKLDTSGGELIPEPKEPKEQPDSSMMPTDLNILMQGGDANSKATEYQIADDDWSLVDSAAVGAGTSVMGTGLMVGLETGSVSKGLAQIAPDQGMFYTPDDEDRKTIIDSGLPSTAYEALLKNVDSKEHLQAKLKVIQQNVKFQDKVNEQGMSHQVAMGLGDFTGDPFSYVPLGYANLANKAFKGTKIINNRLVPQLAESLTTTYLSEKYLRNGITGVEADVGGALIGATVMVTGMAGVSKGLDSMMRRVSNSETALNTGREDPTYNTADMHPQGERTVVDEDTEVLQSGRVMTRGIIDEPVAGEARSDLRFWQHDSITTALKDKATASTAMLFDTPVQGFKDTEFTTSAPTINNVVRNLNDRDNEVFSLWDDYREAEFQRGQSLGKYQSLEDVDVEFKMILDNHDNMDLTTLTPSQKIMIKAYQEFATRHAEFIKDPSRVSGKQGAPAVAENMIDDMNWRTRTYNRLAVNEFVSKFDNPEAAQRMFADAIKKAFHEDMNAARKAYNEKVIREELEVVAEGELAADVLPDELLDKYAMNYAYGVINNGNTTMFDTDMFEGTTTRKTDHFKTRMNIPLHGKVNLPDGTEWSPFKLEYNDFGAQMRSYSTSVNGQIAINAVTGKHVKDFSKEIDAMAKQSEGGKALKSMLDNVLRNSPYDKYTNIDVASDTLRDATLGLTSAMTHTANMVEVFGNLHRQGVVPAAMKHIVKALGKDLQKIMRMQPKTLKREFGTMMMGKALTRRMNMTREDYVNQLMTRVDKSDNASKALANLRYGVALTVDKLPWVRAMRYIHEGMIDAGNQVALDEMLRVSRGMVKGRMLKDTSIVSDKFLQANNIPREVADKAIAHLKLLPDGIDVKTEDLPSDFDMTSWMNSPDTMNVMRLVHAFNDELMAKTDNVGQTLVQPSGAFGRLFWMYKRFATVSTQILSRNAGEIKDLGRVGRMVGVLTAGGLATMHYVGTTVYKASAIDDKYEREKYLDDNLSLDKIAAASLKRHPMLAGWNMIYDGFGGMVNAPYAGIGKTTFEDVAGTYAGRGETSQSFLADVTRNGLGMVAPARVVGAAGAATFNAGHLAWNALDDEHLRYNQEKNVEKALYKSLETFVPNEPHMRKLYKQLTTLFQE